VNTRSVPAVHGWRWIVQGYALFRQNPATWLALVVLLFVTAKLILRIPLFGLAFALFMPIFIAGLMEGCREVERGGRLGLSHLAAGFRRNAAQLVTIGGVSLVGNLVIMMIVLSIGGDAMAELNKRVAQGAAVTAQTRLEMQGALVTVGRALVVGTLASVPLLMALWFAPLLVYFDDEGALAAMKASFVACLKNAGAMLLYGGVIFAAMFLVMPLSLAIGQYDFALLLLAPVVLPSLYVSYKDIFLAGEPPERHTDSVSGSA